MVYSTITDGLGNILFQIAAGSSLARKNNSDFLVCLTDIDIPGGITLKKHIEPFCSNILRKIEFVDGIPDDSVEYIQPGFEFREIEYFDKIRLTGYYQSEKFFDKEHIRELFSIDEETISYIKKTYGDLFKEEIISLHVRRGDYIKRPLRQPICEMPYFNRAINYLGRDKKYLIFSDDIEWCKKKFKGNNFYFSSKESPVVDLYLQSFCTHNIISNSSFSWWGAWLNPNPSKIVIAPVKWFGLQMTHYNLKDLIPNDWIRIKNPRTLYMKLKISYKYFIDLFVRANWKFIRIRNRIKNSRFFSR
ncbi:alpha-1,2-fucosyltransferase [Candidatus Kapaibacterium sp.]